MHHIALCTPCIALFNCGHLLHIWVDHAVQGSEFQAEQIRRVFGGPQASSGRDTNIVVIKVSPGASHQISWLLFVLNHYSYAMLDCALSL
jgi:hypothetical protein